MISQPDAVLCRLAARGNVGAYDALYQRYRQPVYAFVFHLLGRANGNEDAEDITQDAFTRAFAGIRDQNVDGSFRGWLYTIARNRTYDVVRGGRQKVVSLDSEHAEPPVAPQAEEPAERAEQRAEFAWLMTAVAELPERQREALLLREMGGFSHERIAEELGTSVSATKKLISRGRDGVGVAAASVGYRRRSRKRLGQDLALAAPIVPISISLASMGITGGVAAGGAAAGGVLAGGGVAIGGKAAATVLTFIAIGGGAVAVEHNTSSNVKPEGAQERQSAAGQVQTENVAERPGTPTGLVDGRSGHGKSNAKGDRNNSGPGSSTEDRSGRNDSTRRGSGDRARGEDSPSSGEEDRSGSGRGGNSGSSNSGSGSDDAVESGSTTSPSGDDSESLDSGDGSGESSGSGSSGSGKAPETDSGSDDSPGG